MLLFLASVVILLIGYAFYGALVAKIFGANNKLKTPAVSLCDHVDFIALPNWKVFLIQFLNIAGLGPVFGAILGALYGPIALFWIVLGSIFAGGVHDYMAGMMSVREKGCSLVHIVEKYMGKKIKIVFLIFMVAFLLLLGAVFALAPAHMLASIFEQDFIWWIIAVFGYYFMATLLPIDKIIGRFYPIFALMLICVTIALISVLFFNGSDFYHNMDFTNHHPQNLPIFPLMFVTIACGALSGFHATQSPLMARCLQNESKGRAIFYGAMITEGIVALIWATLGMTFYNNNELMTAITNDGPGGVVSQIADGLLGSIGGTFAVLSVIILSITSGDTAFRSARLTIGDYWMKNKKGLSKRMIISTLVLSGGISLSFFDLTVIWTYFGWANQCLAALTLWTACFYLHYHHKPYWLTLIPAWFISAVCISYIMYDKIGFHLSASLSEWTGIICSTILVITFIVFKSKK